MNTLDLHPKRADVGVYDGHEYGASGLTTFVTTKAYQFEGRVIPEGSVFDGEVIELHDGDAELGIFCVGYHSFGPTTTWIEVPAEFVEEDDQEDLVEEIMRRKYAQDAAKDKPGCLPLLFLVHSIRDLEAQIQKDLENWCVKPSKHHMERQRRWLATIKQYKQDHYGNLE